MSGQFPLIPLIHADAGPNVVPTRLREVMAAVTASPLAMRDPIAQDLAQRLQRGPEPDAFVGLLQELADRVGDLAAEVHGIRRTPTVPIVRNDDPDGTARRGRTVLKL